MSSIENLLDCFINNEKSVRFHNYSTDNIQQLLNEFGDPQNSFHSFHIAGSNGKGSVSTMIYSLLQNGGHTTGCYTSPHLLSVNERIRVGANIPDDNLAEILNEIHKKSISANLTYFDVLTAAAFIYFSRERCSYAAIETGLGGRLDSTNIITPVCSIITTVSMDHTHILGDTLEKIASEKCGIIKPGIPVVTSVDATILPIVEKTATENNAKIFRYGKEYRTEHVKEFDDKISFNYHSDFLNVNNILLNANGTFQSINFASAITAMLAAGVSITEDQIYAAAMQFSIPGRFEKGCSTPLIYFDSAHNPESVKSLAAILNKFSGRSIRIFFSCMADKDYETIRDTLKIVSDDIRYITIDDPRSRKNVTEFINLNSDNTDEILMHIGESELNLFTGSFRLYPLFKEICDYFGRK